MLPVALGLLYLLAVNLLTFGAFWLDKRRARQRLWRIPESKLLLLAVIGGWPGAKFAQRRFRHKTQKQPFAMILNVIGIIWAGAIIWAILAFV
jgi:uncharacterized membrane protein YsdA (DUF1294 family)